jgi:uncharacterized protein (DUF1778 family)
MRTPAMPKPERLEARVTREQKQLIEHAAGLEGRTITDFLVASAQSAAKQVIHEHEVLTLNAKEREVFVQALLNPARPTEKARQAARRYKESFPQA